MFLVSLFYFLTYNLGMASIKVGVLRGGPSSEHEVSLQTGENVLKFLPKKYQGVDIFLDRNGYLFVSGNPSKIQHLNHLVDVVFNALHGHFGEDGKSQQIFEAFNLPYVGSGPVASSLSMNKILSRKIFEKAGFKIPRAIVLRNDEISDLDNAALRVFKSISPAWVVKPASAGSSVGVSIAHKFSELAAAIECALNFSPEIIVEEYIKGREATCGVLDNFRGETHYALPAVEIIPAKENKFFNYEAKYGGSSREICPANFDIATKREIEKIAKLAHQILGCEGYSRSDMIVSRNGIYLLEINTLPGLTSESLLPKAASAVGLDFSSLLEHLIELALNKRRRF